MPTDTVETVTLQDLTQPSIPMTTRAEAARAAEEHAPLESAVVEAQRVRRRTACGAASSGDDRSLRRREISEAP